TPVSVDCVPTLRRVIHYRICRPVEFMRGLLVAGDEQLAVRQQVCPRVINIIESRRQSLWSRPRARARIVNLDCVRAKRAEEGKHLPVSECKRARVEPTSRSRGLPFPRISCRGME